MLIILKIGLGMLGKAICIFAIKLQPKYRNLLTKLLTKPKTLHRLPNHDHRCVNTPNSSNSISHYYWRVVAMTYCHLFVWKQLNSLTIWILQWNLEWRCC